MKLLQLQKDLLGQLYKWSIGGNIDNKIYYTQFESYIDIIADGATIVYRLPKEQVLLNLDKVKKHERPLIKDVDTEKGFTEVFIKHHKDLQLDFKGKLTKVCIMTDGTDELDCYINEKKLKHFESPRFFIESGKPGMFYVFENETCVGLVCGIRKK